MEAGRGRGEGRRRRSVSATLFAVISQGKTAHALQSPLPQQAQNFPSADLRKQPNWTRKSSNLNTHRRERRRRRPIRTRQKEGARRVGVGGNGAFQPQAKRDFPNRPKQPPPEIDGQARLIARNPGGGSAYPEEAGAGRGLPRPCRRAPRPPALFPCLARSPISRRSPASPEPPRCRSPTSSPSIKST